MSTIGCVKTIQNLQISRGWTGHCRTSRPGTGSPAPEIEMPMVPVSVQDNTRNSSLDMTTLNGLASIESPACDTGNT